MKYNLINCKVCNKEFRSYSANRKTCSKECQCVFFMKKNDIVFQDEIYTILDISSPSNPKACTIINTIDHTDEIKNNGRFSCSGNDTTKQYVSRSKTKYRRKIKLHQLILKVKPGKIVDHMDGDPFNNTRDNLRECNSIENGRNRSHNSNSTTGFKGVYWKDANNAYQVSIGVRIKSKKKNLYIGLFKNKLDAAKAYNEAALKYHGEFARLNNV